MKFELTPKELEAFDSEQREIVLKLQQGMAGAFEGAVDQAVTQVREEFGRSATLDGLLSMDKQTKAHMQDAAKVRKMTEVWKNNGVIPGTNKRVGYDTPMRD